MDLSSHQYKLELTMMMIILMTFWLLIPIEFISIQVIANLIKSFIRDCQAFVYKEIEIFITPNLTMIQWYS